MRTNRGESEPATLKLTGRGGLGIFTLDGSGCRAPAVLNVADDGSVSINSPENAVSPGEFISVFGTGLGSLPDSASTLFGEPFANPPDGHPAPPGARVAPGREPTPEFWLHREPPAQQPQFQKEFQTFAGRAPGLVGVDQYNLRVPEDAVEGCDVGFRFHFPTADNDRHRDITFLPQSQTIPLSIRGGGGECAPRPYDSLAELTWRRLFRSTSGGVTQEDRLVVRMVRNNKLPIGFRSRPVNLETPASATQAEDIPPNPRCPRFFDETLDAGALTLTGPSIGELVIEPDLTAVGPSMTRYFLRIRSPKENTRSVRREGPTSAPSRRRSMWTNLFRSRPSSNREASFSRRCRSTGPAARTERWCDSRWGSA